MVTIDANEAVASVAHRASEVIAIYPITPSSPMAELCDDWSAHGRMNLWNQVPELLEMQSEAGVAGAVHGALQAGALVTTFTASQGLLLMIPNLYKIAGELTPFVVHVAARTIATHALSIFGDHSDVMACRQTGLAQLCSGSVQEAHDLAAVAHAATLRSRIPFMHFFDGFRTSHEVGKIDLLSNDDLLALFDEKSISEHRARALNPDHPVLRGTAQNPDTFFQAREAINPFYAACPGIVQEEMNRLASRTGRHYRLVDYVGHPQAERVVVMMGSGAETAHAVAEHLCSRGEKVGVAKIRLYRPFPCAELLAAIPATVRSIAVLDRTKEPGAPGDPLFLDVVAAFRERESPPRIVAGRYGLSSKEFDPAMAKAVFDELARPRPGSGFTIGIVDDVSGGSLAWDRSYRLPRPAGWTEAVFYGLGSDGTVGANKNSIKIIGEDTQNDVQGYFVYDSKKSGTMTVSHLRFGPGPIRAPYLIQRAGFVACHQFNFLERLEVLAQAEEGAIFLLNAPFPPGEVWSRIPREIQDEIVAKKIRFYAIDAERVARETGMGDRINSVMQTCFFAISGVLPREEAIARIKAAIEKTYGRKGAEVVRRNFAAVDLTLQNLHAIPAGGTASSTRRLPIVSPEAPGFVHAVTAVMLAGKGDALPVSAFAPDGTWPVGTAKWEKRNLTDSIPVWDASICIECNKCTLVCPHAAIRAKAYPAASMGGAPAGFKSTGLRTPIGKADRYTIQVAPEDCTGCTLCMEVCPAKDRSNPRHKALDMAPQPPLREAERRNFEFFLGLPEVDRSDVKLDLKGSQMLEPLFEFSGACQGCGETPYLKLLSQLFGDRTLIANATGCSSIYGGNLPTTPWTTNKEGRGPAWSNSLFEDNAEFGLGMRVALDSRVAQARTLLAGLAPRIGGTLAGEILEANMSTEGGIAAQRQRVALLEPKLAALAGDDARRLRGLAGDLVKKSVWIVGGDGWAYDIGFGGLDHVLSQHRDVNVLVLDTEVYSNTGGQQSKATPLGASAKFASAGKSSGKKDLGLIAMSYGHVFVAQVAFGAKDAQTVRTLLEAESYPGPSLVIANCPCIAHGYDLRHGLEQQKLAVESGAWPLYRFDPRRIAAGTPPLKLDSGPPKIPVRDYMRNEGRFRMTESLAPDRYKQLLRWAQEAVTQRWAVYEQLSKLTIPQTRPLPDAPPPPEPAEETAAT